MLCGFACSQIFTVVFGLYHFGAIGKTTADCYSVEGNKNPMTKATAVVAGKVATKVPVNVTENFDFMMMLGFYSQISMIAIPLASLLLSKLNAMLGVVVSGLGACAALVKSIILYVCVFKYRMGEAGNVCSGNYIKTDELTAYQKAIVMSSKGSLLFFILVMQWIGVGCCALSCLCIVGKLVMGKASN